MLLELHHHSRQPSSSTATIPRILPMVLRMRSPCARQKLEVSVCKVARMRMPSPARAKVDFGSCTGPLKRIQRCFPRRLASTHDAARASACAMERRAISQVSRWIRESCVTCEP